MFRLLWLVWLFGASVGASLAYAQEQLHFRRLGAREGLPSAFVQDLLQRRSGFVWIATKEGLARYDGHSFVSYSRDGSRGYGLRSNDVISLAEDARQQLWVGTAQGLFRFDDATEQFEEVPLSAATETILAIYTEQERVWVATRNGLFLVDGQQRSARHWLDGVEVHWLGRVDEHLWIATRQGLAVLEDPELPPRFVSALAANITDAIATDHHLWLATDGQGVVGFDTRAEQVFQRYRRSEHGISSDRVTALALKGRRLWLGYAYQGLSSLDLDSGELHHHLSTPWLDYSLPYNNIRRLLIDNEGLLWAASTNGLGVSDLRDRYILHLGEQLPLTDKQIWSVAWQGHTLWLGSENGLNRYDYDSGVLTAFSADDDQEGGLPRTIIWAMVPYQQSLLMGTNRGLLLFSPATEQAQTFGPAAQVYVLKQQAQRLWVGYSDGTLRQFDLQQGTFAPQQWRTEQGYWTAIDSSESGLLLGTEQGLFALRGEHLDPVHPTGWPEGPVHVTAIHWQGATAWISTLRHGLFELRRYQEAWRVEYQLHEQSGLKGEQLRAMVRDQQGFFWLAGKYGLYRFSPDTRRVERFDRYLHWSAQEFNPGASSHQTSGPVVFGGNQGAIVFDPAQLKLPLNYPPVVMTQLQVMDEVRAHPPLPLRFAPDETFYAFTFRALEYLVPDKIRYEYRLLPHAQEWRPMREGQLNLSRLPYQSYQLQVKATDGNQRWNPQLIKVDFTVAAPWWLSSQAKLVYMGVLVSLALVFYLRHRSHMAELVRVADHDPLTLLPNRRYFNNELRQRMQKTEQLQGALALLYFDLNGFKQVNDCYGHDMGDKLLVHVARQVGASVRRSDFFARLSGDEFVIILDQVQSDSALQQTIERVIAAANEPLCHQGERLEFRFSLGVSVFNSRNHVSAERLLQQADAAMYQSKRSGEAVCFYSLAMNPA